MHAEKIRMVNLLAFRLDAKDAIIIMSVIGILGFVLGVAIGAAY